LPHVTIFKTTSAEVVQTNHVKNNKIN